MGAQRAQRPRAQLTGTFGRLRYSEQSGDVNGLEVFVFLGQRRYFALVLMAEGAPADPILVPLTVDGNSIRFELKDGQNLRKYEGGVSADGLYGRFDHGGFSDRADGFFLLRRGTSYWQ